MALGTPCIYVFFSLGTPSLCNFNIMYTKTTLLCHWVHQPYTAMSWAPPNLHVMGYSNSTFHGIWFTEPTLFDQLYGTGYTKLGIMFILPSVVCQTCFAVHFSSMLSSPSLQFYGIGNSKPTMSCIALHCCGAYICMASSMYNVARRLLRPR